MFIKLGNILKESRQHIRLPGVVPCQTEVAVNSNVTEVFENNG